MSISNVYLGDNMKYMSMFPDKYFHLAYIDPPYGINAPNMRMGSHPTRKGDGYPGTSTAVKSRRGRLNSGGGAMKNSVMVNSNVDWDVKPPKAFFDELFRVSKNQIIWGGNYFELPVSRCWLCWDKKQPWDNFSQFELAWTSFDGPAAMFRYSNTGGLNHEQKIHPTQKPVSLYKWQLHKFAEIGDRILDTGMGSQSSRIAAFEMGFDYWGCEIGEKFFEDGNSRFKNETKQLSAFPFYEESKQLILL